MQRRELLMLGGVAALLTGTRALAQNAAGDDLQARLIHVYAGVDGESHVETLTIAQSAGAVPVTSMTASVYAGNRGGASADWHNAPRRQFAINMTGDLEVEVSDGKRQRIGAGDLVFIEDVTGKGHVTRVLTPVSNLFIQVPQDFDVVAWARGV